MKKPRIGKKHRGTHTTYTEVAKAVAEALAGSVHVTGISPGVITPGLRAAKRSIKVTKNPTGALLLKVRDTTSIMELRVMGRNYDAIIAELRKIAESLDMTFNVADRTGS